MAAAPESATAPVAETKEKPKQVDYNPRWKGYVYIVFTSLVCFSSVSNIYSKRVDWAISISIGVVTFAVSIIILVLDRFQGCFESFKFHKYMDGNLEGATLVFFVVWWVAGVCVMTRVGGIGYNALNIYISAWLALAACVYTLNKWSGAKDILTIQELAGVSTTLRGWYTLNFSSIVVLGSASNMYHHVSGLSERQQAAFGVSIGVLSLIISGTFILGHYRFLPRLSVGGWLELAVSFFLILFWVIGIGVLTQDEGIAASINGDCGSSLDEKEEISDFRGSVPGSNLYVFSWLCLVAVIDVAMRWKAAQALSFAHAAQKASKASDRGGDNEDDDDDDDDDDL